MAAQPLIVERDAEQPAIVTLTINRPEVLNALDARTLQALHECLSGLQHDRAARVVILTGTGNRAFVAGADIRELAAQDPAGARTLAASGQRIFALVENLGKPVIAAINGFALGGGCELAMACTVRIAAETATLGQPEIALGLLPGYAGTQRLPRLVGKGRALEMMLTGQPVTAAAAERMGLVNRVVPAADLMAEARKLAVALAAQPPLAVEYILSAVNAGLDMPLPAASAYEAALFGLVATTADMHEGTRAFLEKRKPRFEGR